MPKFCFDVCVCLIALSIFFWFVFWVFLLLAKDFRVAFEDRVFESPSQKQRVETSTAKSSTTVMKIKSPQR